MDVQLKRGILDICVLAATPVTVKTVSGDIKLSSCSSPLYTLESKSGNVSGTLIGDYIYTVTTNSGNITHPEIQTDANLACTVKTNSGDINLKKTANN